VIPKVLNRQVALVKGATTLLLDRTFVDTQKHQLVGFQNQGQRLAGGKWKSQTALLSLENIRTTTNELPSELLEWIKEYTKHLTHIFPHGMDWSWKQKMVVVLSNNSWSRFRQPPYSYYHSPRILELLDPLVGSSHQPAATVDSKTKGDESSDEREC
jgi:hypothetical protein